MQRASQLGVCGSGEEQVAGEQETERQGEGCYHYCQWQLPERQGM